MAMRRMRENKREGALMVGVSGGYGKKPIAQAYQNGALPGLWYAQNFFAEDDGWSLLERANRKGSS
jgi:hypothetical protein